MYPWWGNEGNAGNQPKRLLAGPKRGQLVCNTNLRSGRGCERRTIDRNLKLPTAAHWQERRVSVNQN